MVVKTVLDLLLLFINYTESGDSGGQGNVSRSGRDSPQRTGSPDSNSGLSTAQLLKEAVETVADQKGTTRIVVTTSYTPCRAVCIRSTTLGSAGFAY